MKKVYIISAIGVGVILVGSTLFGVRAKKREQLSSKLLTAISTQIQPATNGISSQNAFDIHYLDKVTQKVSGQILALQKSTAIYYANQIKSAWGAWYQGGDDEQKVYGVFRKLKDKVQVSQVAKAYQEQYSENLIDILKDRFGADEIKIVLNIIHKLPNYRTA